jgi:hypothetical protein
MHATCNSLRMKVVGAVNVKLVIVCLLTRSTAWRSAVQPDTKHEQLYDSYCNAALDARFQNRIVAALSKIQGCGTKSMRENNSQRVA